MTLCKIHMSMQRPDVYLFYVTGSGTDFGTSFWVFESESAAALHKKSSSPTFSAARKQPCFATWLSELVGQRWWFVVVKKDYNRKNSLIENQKRHLQLGPNTVYLDELYLRKWWAKNMFNYKFVRYN